MHSSLKQPSHFELSRYFFVLALDPEIPSGWFAETARGILGPFPSREAAVAGSAEPLAA